MLQPISVAHSHLVFTCDMKCCVCVCVCVRVQDYRSEINEVLACDKQLAEEIEFDLKRFEEEQRRIAKTPAVVTPHAQMVTAVL